MKSSTEFMEADQGSPHRSDSTIIPSELLLYDLVHVAYSFVPN
jgi:hypothetical protein